MQHLNLYDQIDRYVEPQLSARQQLRLVCWALAILVVLYGGLALHTGGKGGELSKLQDQLKALTAQVDQLKAEKARLENDPELDRALTDLESEVRFRQKLLANVMPTGNSPGEGFAPHLSGLARQHIDGMWFTEIQLHSGGQQLALLGQTKAAEYVPQYLQKLSSEPVFEGHRFKVLRMHLPDDRKRTLDFELRAKEVGAAE